MALPANARVQAAQSFVRDVRSVHEFMLRQDQRSADQRYAALLRQLKDAREHLRWNPRSGRPARFLDTASLQGRLSAARAKELAVANGVPDLRELVVKPYVVLYAHGHDRVVLLALKHARELTFKLE